MWSDTRFKNMSCKAAVQARIEGTINSDRWNEYFFLILAFLAFLPPRTLREREKERKKERKLLSVPLI